MRKRGAATPVAQCAAIVWALQVAGGAAQVHQAAAGEKSQALAAGEDELIHLRLDVLLAYLGVRFQPPS